MKDYQTNLVVTCEKTPAYVRVTFNGDFDKAGLEENNATLCTIAESPDSPLMVLDFTSLNFINSEAIGFLLTLHTKLVKRDKKLVLYGASDHVKDVLNVIGLLKIIPHFDSKAEFEKSLQ